MSKLTSLYREALTRDQLVSSVLKASGVLATIARDLAGGRDFTMGNHRSPVHLDNLSATVVRLRQAVDAYDDAILQLQALNRAGRSGQIKDED